VKPASEWRVKKVNLLHSLKIFKKVQERLRDKERNSPLSSEKSRNETKSRSTGSPFLYVIFMDSLRWAMATNEKQSEIE